MVDATARPQAYPLYSDTRSGALTFHDYQRALRSQQVGMLREKTGGLPLVPSTRRVFPFKQLTDRDERMLKSNPSAVPKQTAIEVKTSDACVAKNADGTKFPALHAHSERFPRLLTRERLVKSATARDRHQSWPTQLPVTQQRPKTATCSLASASKQAVKLEAVHTQGLVTNEDDDSQDEAMPQCSEHRKAWSEGSKVEQDTVSGAAERDALVKAFCWSTTTQRANEEAGWADRMAPPVPPPSSTLEHFPDPVSQRLTFRRYHSTPADWQGFSAEWDFVQTRIGTFTKATDFCSPHQKTGHIPGYLGFIAGGSDADDPLSNFTPTLLIKSFKPRPNKISRTANIPGYSGHVHWGSMRPAHANMPHPEPTTTARAHRSIPLDEEVSAFRRNGVFSKMITTVSPHNPFNSREP